MKKLVNLFCAVAVLTLAACSSAPRKEVVYMPAPTPSAPHDASPTDSQVGTLAIPDWFLTPPEQTETEIYSAGTGSSRELNLAMQKAAADADLKLSQKMKSEFRSLRKSYEQETGHMVNKNFELMTKTVTSNQIRGHHQKTAKVTMVGAEYRVFILMVYPLGEANYFAQEATSAKLSAQGAANEKAADRELEGNAAPASEVKGVTLMDVDNAEYKKRRDEALQKPGAVIGNTTVR